MTTTTSTPAVEAITIGPLCPECGVLIAYGDDSGQDSEWVENAEATAAAIVADERGTHLAGVPLPSVRRRRGERAPHPDRRARVSPGHRGAG